MNIKRRILKESALKQTNLPEVLQRVYANRGIKSVQELDKKLRTLLPFTLLKDIDKATTRLERALKNNEKFLIVGDFDADGATSTSVAITALKAFGAKNVNFIVPNRFDFGYGLTPAIIDVAKKWQPDLIITVDNGISSIDGVEHANRLGIDVLITDHHLPAETLPNACAIVNPNQPNDHFSSKSIAGVGVIFYVMLALRRRLADNGWFSARGIQEPNMASFLDLVALGTVADVVGLDQNNRILVNQGLQRIRQGKCRAGIKALLEIAGRDYAKISESDLGFAVAPRLNAAGRLDDMSLGIECLLEENYDKALLLARELDSLNRERRKIETEMRQQALGSLDKLTKFVEGESINLPVSLCLHDDSWHQGVIGILAGRIKDRFHRPVIAFASVNDTELKGSARSIPGLNIRDVLANIDKENPKLITKFGGHAMAAGLSIVPENLNSFKKAYLKEVENHLTLDDCRGEILTDGPLMAHEFSIETATVLREGGPWGQQFPEPVFDNVFEVLEQRIVGTNHLKLTLAYDNTGEIIDAIAFNVDTNKWPNHRVDRLHAAYKLDVNEFRGRTKLQLVITCLVPVV